MVLFLLVVCWIYFTGLEEEVCAEKKGLKGYRLQTFFDKENMNGNPLRINVL